MFSFDGKIASSSGCQYFDICRSQPGQVAKTFSFDCRGCFPAHGIFPAGVDSTLGELEFGERHDTTPCVREQQRPRWSAVLLDKGTFPLVHELNYPGTESELCRALRQA